MKVEKIQKKQSESAERLPDCARLQFFSQRISHRLG